MNAPLRLGFSPCPNDAFVFHALVHGVVAPDLSWDVRLEDVEMLNGLAQDGELDVAKVSYHAFGRIADDWWMLPSGGAMGHGVGPLIVARDPELELANATVATPGGRTTANLLLDLYAPANVRRVELRYDRIMPAVEAGEVDAGLIIHESRFTYADHGLHRVVDLGAWWETWTGAPIPLGGIAVRRDLPPGLIDRVADAVRASVVAARRDPGASAAYVAEHAQEMSPEVRERHIDTYVNDFTLDAGPVGRAAVGTLFERAARRGLFPVPRSDLFWGGA
ncbi:MAG: 1,4-dihydroxy-6-naphthoate synthase [Trueperaceae bacterium]|nr:1,4-dihydroxy-6-naphthoate synthase [Trueperaceae bacterium]